MENKNECEEAIICRDEALKLSSEIEKFTNKASDLLLNTEDLAKKAENMSNMACPIKTGTSWTLSGLFDKKVEIHTNIGEKPEELAVDAEKLALDLGKQSTGEKIVSSVSDMAHKLDDAGEEFGKAYVETLEDATKMIGMAGSKAIHVSQSTEEKIVSSVSDMFAKTNVITEKTPNCIDEACQKTSEELVKLLKSGKDKIAKNESLASTLKLSAEDFVKSLDIAIDGSQEVQSVFDNARKLAEKVAKGDCSDVDESDQKFSRHGGSGGIVSGILSSASLGMGTAEAKYHDLQEIIKERLGKITACTYIRDIGCFVTGVTIGLGSGYLLGYIYKKSNNNISDDGVSKKKVTSFQSFKKLWTRSSEDNIHN